jgi:hypothetical protein
MMIIIIANPNNNYYFPSFPNTKTTALYIYVWYITEKEWKLSTPDNETYCLVHRGDPYEEWCLFDDVSYASRPLLIKELVPKCESHFPKILSTVCNPLKGNRSCTGDEGRENDTRPAEEVEDDDDDAFLKDGDGDGMSISNNNSAGGDKMKKTGMRLLGPLEDDPELVNVDRNVIKKRDGGGESDKNGSSAGPSGAQNNESDLSSLRRIYSLALKQNDLFYGSKPLRISSYSYILFQM